MIRKAELAANVLSSVIVVGGTLFALHGYFFSKGPVVPDWRSRPEQIVIANFDALAEKGHEPIRLRFDDRVVELSKFLQGEHTPSEQTLRSLIASERQIGKLYSEADSPIVVGDIIVRIIDNGSNKSPHLLREPDWASARVGLFSVAFGVLVFFLGQIVRFSNKPAARERQKAPADTSCNTYPDNKPGKESTPPGGDDRRHRNGLWRRCSQTAKDQQSIAK